MLQKSLRYPPLLLVAVSICVSLTSAHAGQAEDVVSAWRAASEIRRGVLTRYAGKVTNTAENSGSAWPSTEHPLRKSSVDTRADGEKFEHISNSYEWYKDGSPPTSYNLSHYVYDGRQGVSLSLVSEAASAFVHMSADERRATRSRHFESGSELLFGILMVDLDPVDIIFSEAEHVSLRRDTIDGVGCSVLEAATSRGRYTVWLDETRGYAVLRASVVREADDIGWMDRRLRDHAMPELRRKYELTDVQLLEIDGHFIPVGATTNSRVEYMDGREHISNARIEIDAFNLDPDFEAMGAFQVEIPEGAHVYDDSRPGLEFVWKNGAAVLKYDVDDLELLAGMVQSIEEQLAPEQPAPAAPHPSEAEEVQTRPSAGVVMIFAACFFLGGMCIYLLRKKRG